MVPGKPIMSTEAAEDLELENAPVKVCSAIWTFWTTASHAAVRRLVSQTTATAAKFLLDQMNLEFWCNCFSNSWGSESFLTMIERLLLLLLQLLPLLLPLLQLPLLLHEDNHLKQIGRA